MKSNNDRGGTAPHPNQGTSPMVLYPGVSVLRRSRFFSQCKRPVVISLEMSAERVRANLKAAKALKR